MQPVLTTVSQRTRASEYGKENASEPVRYWGSL